MGNSDLSIRRHPSAPAEVSVQWQVLEDRLLLSGVEPAGPAFLVGPQPWSSMVESVATAWGNFSSHMMTVWEDTNQVFAQYRDYMGRALAPVYVVGAAPMMNIADTAVAMNDAGIVAVAWLEGGEGFGNGGTVFINQYDLYAHPIAEPIELSPVEDGAGGISDIGLAMDLAGNLLVSWVLHDYDAMAQVVQVRQLDANGQQVWPLDLSVTAMINPELSAAVACDPVGNFAVAWSTNEDVYYQRYDLSGAPTAAQVWVTAGWDPVSAMDASIAVDSSGAVAVSWFCNHSELTAGVWGRLYDAADTPILPFVRLIETPIMDEPGTVNPGLAAGIDGFALSWMNGPSWASGRAMLQRFDGMFEAQGPTVCMLDPVNYWAVNPVAAGNESQASALLWLRGEMGDGDLMAVLDDGSGAGRLTTVRLLESGFDVLRLDLAAAMDSMGNFIVLWVQTPWDGATQEIVWQPFAADGTPAGPARSVATADGSASFSHPSAVVDWDGSILITWHRDTIEGDNEVWLTRLDSQGEVVLEPRVMLSAAPEVLIEQARVAVAADGTLRLIWRETDEWTWITSIQLGRFTSDGQAVGSVLTLSNNEMWIDQPALPDLVARSDGSMLAVWRQSTWEIMGRIVYPWSVVGSAQVLWSVGPEWAGNQFGSLSLAADFDGWRLVGALDSMGGRDVLARHIVSDGTLDGAPRMLMPWMGGGGMFLSPQVSMTDGVTYVLWSPEGLGPMLSRIEPDGLMWELPVNLGNALGGEIHDVQLAAASWGEVYVGWAARHWDDESMVELTSLYVRKFTDGGTPLGGPILVARGEYGAPYADMVLYDMDVDSMGRLLVVWHSIDSLNDIGLRRLDWEGVVDLDMRIGVSDWETVSNLDVASGNWGFALARDGWSGSDYGLAIQRYDEWGAPTSDLFVSSPGMAVETAEMVMDGMDNLAVFWGDWGQGGAMAAFFDASNRPLGRPVGLPGPEDMMMSVSAAMDWDGRFTVVWESMWSTIMARPYQPFVEDPFAPQIVSVMVNDTPELGLSAIEARPFGIQTVTIGFSEPVLFDYWSVRVTLAEYPGGPSLGPAWPLDVQGNGTDTMRLIFDAQSMLGCTLWITLDADLDDMNGMAVTDEFGNLLDGEPPPWGSGLPYLASAVDLPSGDGIPGGTPWFFAAHIIGDVHGDTIIDERDIDDLFAEGRAGTNRQTFDLTGDGLVDKTDVDFLIQSVLGTRYGDYNLDGRVTGADFMLWQASYPKPAGASWSDGDGDGDGMITGADFMIWQSNYGPEAGKSAASPAALTREETSMSTTSASASSAPALDALAASAPVAPSAAVPPTVSIWPWTQSTDLLVDSSVPPPAQPAKASVRRIAKPAEMLVDALDLASELTV